MKHSGTRAPRRSVLDQLRFQGNLKDRNVFSPPYDCEASSPFCRATTSAQILCVIGIVYITHVSFPRFSSQAPSGERRSVVTRDRQLGFYPARL